jgi:hypothetical protein
LAYSAPGHRIRRRATRRAHRGGPEANRLVAVDSRFTRLDVNATSGERRHRTSADRAIRTNEDACRDTKLYAHVYDDTTRQKVALLASQYANLAQWQGVENVVSSALSRGGRAPYRWLRPTLVVHDLKSDGACAATLHSFLRAHIADWYSPDVICVLPAPVGTPAALASCSVATSSPHRWRLIQSESLANGLARRNDAH